VSATAPWFALSVDWPRSTMFRGASVEVVLIWPLMLAYAKAFGRGGRVVVDEERLASFFGRALPAGAFREIVTRGVAAEALTYDERGGALVFTNWRTYQQPLSKARYEAVRAGGNGSVSKSKSKSERAAEERRKIDAKVKDEEASGELAAARKKLFAGLNVERDP